MNNSKVVVITGGTSGIGKAISLKFLSEGYIVYSTSRSGKTIYENTLHHNIALDLSNNLSVIEFKAFIDNLPRLDCFIHNAGCSFPELFTDLTDENISIAMNVNLISPVKLSKSIGDKMKSRKMGKILFISSIASVVSKDKSSVYSASKAGILGLSRTLALELASSNVLVNSLSPGPTWTPMVERLIDDEGLKEIKKNIPLGDLAKAEDIAKIAYFLCSHDNAYITGQNIIADGGFTCR